MTAREIIEPADIYEVSTGLGAGCATHVFELWAERDKPVFRCELCAVLTETIDGVLCSGTA